MQTELSKKASDKHCEQSATQKERNYALDILKSSAALLVVYIHFGFKGYIGAGLLQLARIAVPLFFIITGYYLNGIITKGRFSKYLKKIFLITAGASIFYVLLSIAVFILKDKFPYPFLYKYSAKSILAFIFCNVPTDGFHLWYLFSLIYALLIIRLIYTIKLQKMLIWLFPLLLFLHIALNYGGIGALFKVRNFLFFALPFLCAGIAVRKYAYALTKRLTKKRFFVIMIVCMAGLAIEVAARLLFQRYVATVSAELYISTSVMALLLVVFAIKNPTFGKGSLLAKVGERYSTGIYIYHVFIGSTLCHIFQDIISWEYVKAIIIFILTAIFVASYKEATGKLQQKLRSK